MKAPLPTGLAVSISVTPEPPKWGLAFAEVKAYTKPVWLIAAPPFDSTVAPSVALELVIDDAVGVSMDGGLALLVENVSTLLYPVPALVVAYAA